ncbi:MAG: DEAD/DEAH box helicase family protein [Chloroflexi bacterium]|nr:DEAD/DEAH box helicase family protein [Chloroflexota bacterium]
MTSPFQSRRPNVSGNPYVRTPQREAYDELRAYAAMPAGDEREVGVVLPVGCGKSGCITLTPFAFRANRVLVIAPGIPIADQLTKDFDPTNASMFYQKCQILDGGPYPEPVVIRGTATNRMDWEEAHVVITNIQQLIGGEANRRLQALPRDFFDLILFDEGHHSVAESYTMVKAQFPAARIVNFSATPLRSDGQLMAGRILYSYPIFRAIQEGYVKRLKAVQLNPRSLRYVRGDDDQEIVTSRETLNTIVDASIRQLDRLRAETGENRLKIIASALNYEHCGQIVEAYRSRNRRADYVHSLEDSAANQRIMQRLESHQLDVIVQVRKLGEGFDHPFLSVAAVFSIFSNLSPFVQFVGRIMRVIEQNAPGHVLNQGVVVFHAGANIARQWSEFQAYSEADQDFFDQLLPLESIDPNDQQSEREIDPVPRLDEMEVRAQSEVALQEIPLLQDEAALAALRLLQAKGYTPDDITVAYQTLQPVPTTKVSERQAMRDALNMRVMNEARRILGERGSNPEGGNLDRQRRGRTNLIVMKTAIDRQVNAAVGKSSSQRHELTRPELDLIEREFLSLVAKAVSEVFSVKD